MDNYLETVNELNQELFEKHREVDRDFSYSSNGAITLISFGEILLWSTEMDEREFIEGINEYEPLTPFIKREYNRMVTQLFNTQL